MSLTQPARSSEAWRIGSTEVFGTRHHGMQLTVVGEVPRRTLELIADAIVPQ